MNNNLWLIVLVLAVCIYAAIHVTVQAVKKSKRKKMLPEFRSDVGRLETEKDLHKTDLAQYLMRELANNGVLPEEVDTTIDRLKEYEQQGFDEMADYYIKLAKHENKTLLTANDFYNEYLVGTPGAITMASNVDQVMIRLQEKLAGQVPG